VASRTAVIILIISLKCIWLFEDNMAQVIVLLLVYGKR